MLSEISVSNGKWTITYQCESNLQFLAKQEQVKFEIEKRDILSQSNNGENNCLLKIKSYTKKQAQGNGRFPLSVTYNCDSTAKSLQWILEQQQRLKEEEKIDYFCQLIELAQIHETLKLIHQNIKPSNVIWYKNKFYLINFGQLKDNPSQYVIKQNYVDGIKDDNYKRCVYPYLTYQFLSEIKEHLGNLTEMEKIIKNRKKEDLQKDDRYALGVMMLELFVPLENIYQNFGIKTCIDQANKREVQLKRIYECQYNYGKETIDKVYKIIHDIIFQDKFPQYKEILELKQIFMQHNKQANNQTQRTDDNNDLSIVNNSFVQNQIQNEISHLIKAETLEQKMNINNKSYYSKLIKKETYSRNQNNYQFFINSYFLQLLIFSLFILISISQQLIAVVYNFKKNLFRIFLLLRLSFIIKYLQLSKIYYLFFIDLSCYSQTNNLENSLRHQLS